MNKDPGEPSSVPFIAAQHEGVTYLADGTSVLQANVVGNVDPEQAREMVAEAHGMSPDSVIMSEVDGQPYDRPSKLGRKSVAFSSSSWRSSWNPGADPSQN